MEAVVGLHARPGSSVLGSSVLGLDAGLCSATCLRWLRSPAVLALWPRSPAHRIWEEGDGNRSFLPNGISLVSSRIGACEDVVSR
jgi:hypothetical protein